MNRLGQQGAARRGLARLVWCAALAGVALIFAGEARPLLAPGATREEVIDAYGWPTGQSWSGTREILSYPQGTVTLERDRLEAIAFTLKPPWPPPRPRPPWAVRAVEQPAPLPPEWLAGIDEARRLATERKVRILGLFADADSSAASKLFDEAVARDRTVVDTLAAEFVLLRIELAARATVEPNVREQNRRWAEKLAVRAFPSLLLLSPEGEPIEAVDVSSFAAGDSPAAAVLAAVTEAKLRIAQRESEAMAALVLREKAAPKGSASASPKTVALVASLFRARWLLMTALILGLGLIGALAWLTWRRWAPWRRAPEGQMALRISDAAGGLPSQTDLLAWPRGKLAELVAALLEAEGYVAQVQPAGGDKDVVLRPETGEAPNMLICCAGCETGVVTAKLVRELFATMTAEGVESAWFVAPAGFTPDAKAFATLHRIQLIDAIGLAEQLRDLPPLVVPKVMGKVLAGARPGRADQG
jgi:hypothetical protein